MGVDLGSSTTTVSTRRDGDGPQTRIVRHDATALADAETARADEPERTDEPVLVGLAVPATWSPTRRRAHAEAAANAGFDASFMVSEPEAAARRFAETRGRPIDPDTPLVVCNLGAASCHAAVVVRDGDRYRIEAAKSADDLGGRAFDQLLLDHLGGRLRHSDAAYWARVQNPGETALRTGVLDEVRRARERLSDHPSAAVALPGLDRELRLTHEDADQCLAPAVLRAVSLVEDAMREAGVETGELAALLLVGGASRTPLVASVLGHHLGVEPVRPELPDLVIAEGAALAALARTGGDETAPAAARLTRLRASSDVLVTMMVVVVAVAAFAGVALLNRDGPATQELDAGTAAPSAPGASGEQETGEATPGGTEGEPTGEPAPPDPSGVEESADDRSASPTPTATAMATVASDPTAPASSASRAADAGATVPNVVGESVADAERLLAAAGFTNVVSEGAQRTGGPEYDDCEVTAQSPGGGSRLSPDDPITVEYLHVGNDSC
jgi:hypothetical protein